VSANAAQLTSAARAITVPPASTSPIVTGAISRRTVRCQVLSRNRCQRRKACVIHRAWRPKPKVKSFWPRI
jgi:hypothetical protein